MNRRLLFLREPFDRPTSPRVAAVIGAVALTIAAGLLFFRLGFYPFWGDEADTVVFARGVWETGDLSPWYGDNLYAYRNGTLLEHLKGRSAPPLAYYLAAPFWGVFGPDRFALRLPFALCGLATLGIVLRWAYRRGADVGTFVLLACAASANTALLLYSRQCRYFALGMLTTAACGYLYDTFDGSRRKLVGLAVCLTLSAATHYLNFAATAAAIVCDFLVWRRREVTLSLRQWLVLVGPPAVALAGLAYVYNPLGKNLPAVHLEPDTLADRLELLKKMFLGLNDNEFGVGLLLAAAPVVGLARRKAAPLRMFAAAAVFVCVTTGLSPQPAKSAIEPDVRYLAPLIPLCLALTVCVVRSLTRFAPWSGAGLMIVAVGSNVLHVPWAPNSWRSTIAEFAHELVHPRRTAGEEVGSWLRANVAADETVWIVPNEWCAPQLILAPHARYAWQLDAPRRADDYRELPAIHFYPHEPVDWIVVFGFESVRAQVEQAVLPALRNLGYRYEPAGMIDRFYDDRTRPEFHWHWFRDRPYDKTTEGVYVYRRR